MARRRKENHNREPQKSNTTYLRKTVNEFCLFNTWILMRVLMFFYPKALGHPWKQNPISLKNWIRGYSELLLHLSRTLTIMFILMVVAILQAIASYQ